MLGLKLLRVPGAPQGSEHQGQMGPGHRNPSSLCDTTCAQSCPLYLDRLKRGVRKRQPPVCRMRFPRHSFHSLSTPSHLFGEASPAPHTLLPAVHFGSEVQAPGCRSMAPAHFPDFLGRTIAMCTQPWRTEPLPAHPSLRLHSATLSEISITSQTGWILLCPFSRAHPGP